MSHTRTPWPSLEPQASRGASRAERAQLAAPQLLRDWAPGGPGGRRAGISHAPGRGTPSSKATSSPPSTWRLTRPACPHSSLQGETPWPTQASSPVCQGLKAMPCTGLWECEDRSSVRWPCSKARVPSPQSPGDAEGLGGSSPGPVTGWARDHLPSVVPRPTDPV